MVEATGVGGFKAPEPDKKPETKGPSGSDSTFKLEGQKGKHHHHGGGMTVKDLENKFIDAFGKKEGKQAFDRFMSSFMITAVNQMHSVSQAAVQREKEMNQQSQGG
ncbi:MAG: hypothetical protein H7A36_01010 [Chlamydiales bacterium]|nr:hypothetical protein [Chlamydiales bacterium]